MLLDIAAEVLTENEKSNRVIHTFKVYEFNLRTNNNDSKQSKYRTWSRRR